MKSFSRTLLAGAVASMIAAPAAFAQVTIGTPNTVQANSFPFGSSVGFTGFQQIYSASLFSGPLNINSVSLYNTRGTGNFQVGTFNLFLSTTTVASSAITNAPVADPTNLSANRTGPLQAFASVTYSANSAVPTIVTFMGTPFMYDPSAGNLLFEVQFAASGFNTNAAFFDRVGINDPARNLVGTASTRSAFLGTNGSPNSGFVTTFGVVPTSTVPEPSTWALMAAGLAGLGVVSRRRKSRNTLA